MAMTKKKVPADTILKADAKSNYASFTVKGKGPSKKQDVKAACKKEGGMGGKKKK